MILTRSCTNTVSTSLPSQCCIVRVPETYLTAIIDIHWDDVVEFAKVSDANRPNNHSFILGSDTLPIGYSYNSGDNILYFPPGVAVKPTQFAVWTSTGDVDSCGAFVWEAVAICVTVNCGNCSEIV